MSELVLEKTVTKRVLVSGQVQGVGFRPFVARLATELGLAGSVANRIGVVDILVNGDPDVIDVFVQRLQQQSPPMAQIDQVDIESYSPGNSKSGFVIESSNTQELAPKQVPPDVAICETCLQELRDPANRRYRYPFITCADCGPRYTIIESLPYDRQSTGMKAFALCAACEKEYHDRSDRRCHAQAIACAECGPKVTLYDSNGNNVSDGDNAVNRCIELLQQGSIVAVKGIGGFHLLVDAGNTQAVEELRKRKQRPAKPFAVMFPMPVDAPLAEVERDCVPDGAGGKLLLSAQRPVVLLPMSENNRLSYAINPGLMQVGAMLPYSPLHVLLLDGFGAPLVATSANISGEPLVTDLETLNKRLQGVFDAVLDHDRPILHAVDDAVYRKIAGQYRPLRTGRGVAPLSISGPFIQQDTVRPGWLATGGNDKITVALAHRERMIVSPHIGDIDTPDGKDSFEKTVVSLRALYGIDYESIVCDAHPGYATHRWAPQGDKPVSTVLHHHAHASACWLEQESKEDMLVFTWDGYGLGEDQAILGAEVYAGGPGRWQRSASFTPLNIPGANRASREVWRCRLAARAMTGQYDDIVRHEEADKTRQQFLRACYSEQWAGPVHSVGRLFDAAASLLLNIDNTSYEAEAASRLEAICEPHDEFIDLPIAKGRNGIYQADWKPLFRELVMNQNSRGWRAALFHNSLARIIVKLARLLRAETGLKRVGLTGGVFQNDTLATAAQALLNDAGFDVVIPSRLPVNDAGLSCGQLVEVIYGKHYR